MDKIEIHTIITSRYLVFDRSGRLPFSIVFGLCRRSDTDPRPLVFNPANSVLDIPYALSHKLITLRRYDDETNEDVAIDVGEVKQDAREEDTHVTLSSPVDRTENWKKAMTLYHYHVDPDSELAALFEPGKRYRFKNNAHEDMCIKECKFLEPDEAQQDPSTSSNQVKLFCKQANGWANFTAHQSLPRPPKIETRMRLHRSQEDNTGNDGSRPAPLLEISVSNTSTEAFSVQTNGRQRFLVPRGPLSDEDGSIDDDARPRIIDSQNQAPTGNLTVLDPATKTTVREVNKAGACKGVFSYDNHDPRPKLEYLATLKPGEPLVRRVDLGVLTKQLQDGSYALRLEPRGLWWCAGGCEDFAEEEEDGERVPQRLYNPHIPPLVLECEDLVEIQVENGVVI